MGKYTKGQKRLANIKKQRQKYPSLVEKVVEKADIILEILDARFIDDTRNLLIEDLVKKKEKKIIYVLNKSDLIIKKSVPKINPHVFISCKNRKGIKKLRDFIKVESKKVDKKQGEKFDKIIVGVIGYPNVGKSSVINLLVGKRSAGVGSEAGFTKGMQKLKLTSEIVLLDTPGVIPKQEYSSSNQEAIAKHAKVGGRSYSQVKEPEMVVDKLMKEFPKVLEKYYKISSKGDAEVLIEELGRKKGFLKSGGKIDVDKTARLILKAWQEGKIKV